MPWHDVQQGDTLMALAAKHGLDGWKQIYERPENQALRERQAEPGILQPGERIFIPNRQMRHAAAQVDQRHSFRISPPAAFLRLAMKNSDGAPRANRPFRLDIGSQTFEGNTDAQGLLEQAVPVSSRSGRLSIWPEGVEEPEIWDLDIGAMDPPGTIAGLQARLRNLGYDCAMEDGDLGPATTAAILAFQLCTGLEPTGQPNDDLDAELARYYDPDQDEREQEALPTAEESPSAQPASSQEAA